MASTAHDSATTRLRNGVRASVRNNFTAYGFSIMITATFGAAVVGLGQPTMWEVLLFVVAAVGGFTLIEAVASGGFRHGLRGEPSDVVALGTAFSLISTAIAVSSAIVAVELVASWPGWLLAPFVATCVYVLAVAAEMALAEYIRDQRS